MAQTKWAAFGPDPPAATLPAEMQACLPPAPPSLACDAIIGAADSGTGYCAADAYKTTTYCACVNNIQSCPQFSMASCANAAYAYRPAAWYAGTGPGGLSPSYQQSCATSPICVNIVDVGGSQNLVSGITQQCGVITNVTNVIKASPILAILAFILIVALVYVLMSRTDDDDDDDAGGDNRGRGDDNV
jgi:hypothetical protein